MTETTGILILDLAENKKLFYYCMNKKCNYNKVDTAYSYREMIKRYGWKFTDNTESNEIEIYCPNCHTNT